MILRSLIVGMVGSTLLLAVDARAEPLTTSTIIELTQLGLGDEAIIAKVKADGTPFDLSAEQMIALRRQGVSSAVIAAMLGNKSSEQAMSMDSPDPAIRHPSGVYLLTGSGAQAKMRRIDPTVSNQAKTGGIFGYALTGGLASASVKVVIQNQTAAVQTSGNPRFYFFFDQATNTNASGTWASGMNTVVSSPAEFTLIRLTRKEGRREARVGSMNIGGAKMGVMDKDRIPFQHQMLRQGVYQVDVNPGLPSGEYGFIFSLAGGGTGGAMTARIFDFTVDTSIAAARPMVAPRPSNTEETPERQGVAPVSDIRPSGTKSSRGTQLPRGVRCDTCR